MRAFLTVAALFIAAILIVEAFDPPDETGAQQTANRTVMLPAPPQWYAGGTLHNATGSQWMAAPKRDRLATAADWISGVQLGRHGRASIIEGARFRSLANTLERCVTRAAATGSDIVNISAACMVLLWGGAPAP